MLKGVSAANLVRRHRLGLAVLQTYNISRQLVRHKDHAQLLPHVGSMKRIPKFARVRTKTPAGQVIVQQQKGDAPPKQ